MIPWQWCVIYVLTGWRLVPLLRWGTQEKEWVEAVMRGLDVLILCVFETSKWKSKLGGWISGCLLGGEV